jgi:hypothetical protein
MDEGDGDNPDDEDDKPPRRPRPWPGMPRWWLGTPHELIRLRIEPSARTSSCGPHDGRDGMAVKSDLLIHGIAGLGSC